MKRLAISCSLALAVATYGRIGEAQCKADTDCKGDRICENGQCVAPAVPSPLPAVAASSAPTPAAAPARRAALPKSGPIEPFGKGYFEFDVMIGISAWGQKKVKSDDPAVQDNIENQGLDARAAGTGPYGGIYIAPRWAASPNFHLGIYLRVGAGENIGVRIEDSDAVHYSDDDLDYVGHLHFGVGGSLKFGGMANRRVWVGGGLDFGYHLTKVDDTEAILVYPYGNPGDDERYHGFELLPRVGVDIFLFNFNGFKMSIPISVGAAIVPYARWKPEDSNVEDYLDDNDATVWSWQIEPVLMFGFAVGA